MKTVNPPFMLPVGTHLFAPSASALVDTLFNPSGTADGIYSVRKNGVMFKRPNGDPFAFLVANPGQSQFFVTAWTFEGRTHYMRGGLTDESKRLLGVDRLTYSELSDEAARIWDLFRPAATL